MRCIDYGSAMFTRREQLLPLPAGAARELPGLALCCPLAGCGPRERALTEGLPKGVCSALCTEEGVLLVMEEGGQGVTLNQWLAEPCEEGRGLPAWDPMVSHHHSSANNYNAAENLVTMTDAYTSAQPVCAFYTNRGYCYKGDFCPEQHSVSRHGAVTVDREQEVLGGRQHLSPPRRSGPVRALLASLHSPSHFYLTFPDGLNRFEVWQESLHQFYSSLHTREYHLPSLPAPGSLLAARARDGRWHRGLTRTGPCAEGPEDVEHVFLMDLGREEEVDLRHLRRLDTSFHSLAQQSLLCRLAGVEPLGDTWGGEAAAALQHLATGRLTARLHNTRLAGDLEAQLVDLEVGIGEEALSVAGEMVGRGVARQVEAQGCWGVRDILPG